MPIDPGECATNPLATDDTGVPTVRLTIASITCSAWSRHRTSSPVTCVTLSKRPEDFSYRAMPPPWPLLGLRPTQVRFSCHLVYYIFLYYAIRPLSSLTKFTAYNILLSRSVKGTGGNPECGEMGTCLSRSGYARRWLTLPRTDWRDTSGTGSRIREAVRVAAEIAPFLRPQHPG